MNNPALLIYTSSKKILSNKNYLRLFLLLVILLAFVLVFIPVFTIPGNDFFFQISTYGLMDYIVIIILSVLTGLLISMNIYTFKRKKAIRDVGKSAAAGSYGIVASVFGTASCSMCVAAIFGFLGGGAVLFLIKFQWYVFALSSLLLLASLYYTSLHIQNECKTC